jgi:hypothetical protein
MCANLIATFFLILFFYRKIIISSAFKALLIILVYARSNSGFKIMSWGGINSAPSLFKVSSPCKNASGGAEESAVRTSAASLII